MPLHRRPGAAILAAVAAFAASAMGTQAASSPVAGGAESLAACRLQTIGHGKVRAVLDSRTVILDDGREMRLAALELPPSAKPALESLLAGRDVTLEHLRPEADRYGRQLVFMVPAGEQQPVQHLLLAQGQARVAAHVGDPRCAAALLAAESTARNAGLGLWSEPSGRLLAADDPAAVLGARGRFAVVKGDVLSVREFHGVLYVNFGRRWSEDFTVTVLKRNERAFTRAGMDLRKLAGRSVRVRGFVEERGGPWIEATRPEQIEIAP